MVVKKFIMCLCCISCFCGCANVLDSENEEIEKKADFVVVKEHEVIESEECTLSKVETSFEDHDEQNQASKIDFEHKEFINDFFFADEIEKVTYDARFSFTGKYESIGEVELHISQVEHGNNGNVYGMKINCGEMANELLEERLFLGYFYVTEDKIYFVPGWHEKDTVPTEQEFITDGFIVCQEETKEKGERSDGMTDYIVVEGEQCEYYSYNDSTGTGFYEQFIWEKDKGLIKYKSGFGAEKDGIQITLKGTEILETYISIEEYLLQEVPEINEYAEYLAENSQGEVHLKVQVIDPPKEILDDRWGKGSYYGVYVGEQHSDYNVKWEYFYVEENLERVIWHNLYEDRYYSLEEWRNEQKKRE